MEAKRRKSDFVLEMKRGLTEAGDHVEVSGHIKGPSGAHSDFDILVMKDGKTVPVDIRLARGEHVGFAEILETYTKVLDSASRPAVVVAVPHASQEAKKAAAAFALILVEGDEVSEIVQKLHGFLSKV